KLQNLKRDDEAI
ncbi:hypothetical protein BVZ75_00833B, partial [Haemophilus influenzae]